MPPYATPRHKPMNRCSPVHQVEQTDRQAKRALATNSSAWRRIRTRVLFEQPLCPNHIDRIVPATQVDHIDGNASNNARDNLQGLCASCHSSKTNREQGGFGNPTPRT